MRRLLPLVLLVVAACGPGAVPTASPGRTGGQTAGPGATTAPPAASGPGATSGPPATGSTGVVIPETCAAGFIAYLKEIEPLVSGFDPATAELRDFFEVEDAAQLKGLDLMTANGSRATYSCSEVGLEFNYFDTNTPWAAVHAVAAASAPGTVPYLQTMERVAALDTATFADFAIASCDAAVTKIKADVAAGKAAGNTSVDDLPVDAGLALLGLYNAFVANVREGTCQDALGNDEFGFMGAH